MLAQRLYRSGVAGKYGMRVKKKSKHPLQNVVQDDVRFPYDTNPATSYHSVFNLTLLKSAAVLGGISFIIGLSIWIRSQGPGIFDNWVNAGIKAHTDPMDGMCTNLAGSLMPGSFDKYAVSTWENCEAGDCGISCPVSPLVQMEILGFAMSITEFGNMYWYASTLTMPVAMMSATMALIAAKLYVGRATEANKKFHQEKLEAFNSNIEMMANASLKAMSMGVFSTRIIWSMAAFNTVNRVLLREANRMASALSLEVPDGNGGYMSYPEITSVLDLFSKIADVSNFPASSILSTVPQWIDDAVEYVSSEVFTGMSTLIAGAASGWMYILTNGLWMFHVGLACGALALTHKVIKHYMDSPQKAEADAVLPYYSANVPATESSCRQSIKWMDRLLLLPFGFASDTLTAMSEPKTDLDRHFALAYQVINLGTMVGLVSTVLLRMGRPGNLLSTAFFQDKAKLFYGLLLSNLFGEKGVTTKHDQWARESVSTIISYTLSLETMLGYFVYGVCAMAATGTFLAFGMARIWQQYKSQSTSNPQPAAGPAVIKSTPSPCRSYTMGALKYGYFKTQHAFLDEGHDGWKYTKAAISAGLVVLTLASFSLSIHSSLDGACPVNEVPGFWQTITANADVVFDGFPKCKYANRGLAMGEAVSTGWPLMALGISVVVAKLDVLSTALHFVLHCCNLRQPKHLQQPTLAGYEQLIEKPRRDSPTESSGSSDDASDDRSVATPSPDSNDEREAKRVHDRGGYQPLGDMPAAPAMR
ncbi:MAG: hypothetical protein P1U63_08410 [Coxiellaceae bacterium]|nr:hypothetical protein [Coxiellaceae bacterium]